MRAPRLVLLLLAVVLVAHGAGLAWWFSLDQLPARSICCDLSEEAVRAVARPHRVGFAEWEAWEPKYGVLAEAGAALFRATGAVDAFQWVVGLCAVALGLVLFDLGRLLAGPWAGLLAAALAPVTPILAFASRRWDAQLPLGLLVAAGVWALVRSRALTRAGPALALVGVALLAAIVSPRETDNLLALGALAGAAAAAAGRGLALGRDALGDRISRGRVAVGLAVVVGLAAWGAASLIDFSSPEGAAYYASEAGRGVGGLSGLSAYAGHLFWRGLTPWLAVPLEVGALLWLARGRGRAELAGWVLLPLIALSLLPKRNYYYLSVIWPALPLLLALGVAALPVPRWLRGLVGVGLVGVGLWQVLDRSTPRPPEAATAAQQAWLTGGPTWGGVFQTRDGDLDLTPRRADWVAPSAAALAAAAPFDPCTCRSHVLVVGGLPWSHLAMGLLAEQPCMKVRSGERPPRQGATVGVVGEARALERAAGALSALDLVEVARIDGPNEPLVVRVPRTAPEACRAR